MIILPKNRKFYGVLVGVFIALTAMVILALRGVFGAISLAGEVDEGLLGSTTPRLDRIKIDEALGSIKSREIPILDL
jgi:hypothetical protein